MGRRYVVIHVLTRWYYPISLWAYTSLLPPNTAHVRRMRIAGSVHYRTSEELYIALDSIFMGQHFDCSNGLTIPS